MYVSQVEYIEYHQDITSIVLVTEVVLCSFSGKVLTTMNSIIIIPHLQTQHIHHTYVHIHTYIGYLHTYIRMYVCNLCMYVCIYTYIHTYIIIYIHIHKLCIYTHTYIYTST